VVSATLQPHNSRRNKSQFPFNKGTGDLEPVWTWWGEKYALPVLGIEILLGHSTPRLVAVSTAKSQLLKCTHLPTIIISDEVGNGT
jgi:hypothetical protein